MQRSSRSAYIEKLKDPRWQKKRLEIFDRDKWTCQFCAATDKTLHCHHLQYTYGKDPWDYNNSHLLTLCAECHEAETNFRKEAEDCLMEVLRMVLKAKADEVHDLACLLYFCSDTAPFTEILKRMRSSLLQSSPDQPVSPATP